MKAVWESMLLAESDETVLIEGNHYFPPDSVKKEHLRQSNKHTTCPWKGEASYYHIAVGGKSDENAAWYYPEPKEAAKSIKDHVAFGRRVSIVD